MKPRVYNLEDSYPDAGEELTAEDTVLSQNPERNWDSTMRG